MGKGTRNKKLRSKNKKVGRRVTELKDAFDDESAVLEHFQGSCASSYHNLRFLRGAHGVRASDVFDSLTAGSVDWVDRSKDTETPPDFVNEELKVMFEFFRVDDQGRGKNSTRKREAGMRREVLESGIMDRVGSNAVLYTSTTHGRRSYASYLKNVKDAVEKHRRQIATYRANYPGYELGFFIFDESDSFVGAKDLRSFGGGQYDQGYWHSPAADGAFIDMLRDCDIDYLIWYSPYKQPDDLANGATFFAKSDLVDPGHDIARHHLSEPVSIHAGF